MKKTRCALILACILFLLCAASASACTAVYVGKDASADGTVLIAKSNDYPDVWPNYIAVTEHVDGVPGRTMPVNNKGTVRAEIPAATYRYTSTPFTDSGSANSGLAQDATVCANECGVSMVMSITAFTNKKALAADPLIPDGLTEFTAVDLVICQSATAREAVQVLCGILDRYGSSECNIALITDREETWYVEMYTGHQYAAVKLPTDKVCVFGNEFTLEYVSDYQDSVLSPDLANLAEEHGFAVYGREGEMNLYKTYSGREVRTAYSHMRTWIGHRVLAPDEYGADYDPEGFYPLCFSADRKVSLQDVMELIRNRFEGTAYCPDDTGRTDMRVIGTDTALSVHILEVYPDLAPEICTVTWESTAPALYGVFVPVSSAMTQIRSAYGLNQPAEERLNFDTAYPWYVFKALNTLCVEKGACGTYGAPARQYWHRAEARMIEGMRAVLAKAAGMESGAAAALLTGWCTRVQEQAFTDAKILLNDVLRTMAKNSNTMKNGRNPETGETLDEQRTLPPMEIRPSGEGYGIPD